MWLHLGKEFWTNKFVSGHHLQYRFRPKKYVLWAVWICLYHCQWVTWRSFTFDCIVNSVLLCRHESVNYHTVTLSFLWWSSTLLRIKQRFNWGRLAYSLMGIPAGWPCSSLHHLHILICASFAVPLQTQGAC